MSEQGRLAERVAEALDSVNYQVEDLVLSLTSEFIERMECAGVSRAELARRMNVQPPRITRILQGNDNFTLRTIVSVADALGCRMVFAVAPRGTETRWKHCYTSDPAEAKMTTGAPAPAKRSDYSRQPLRGGSLQLPPTLKAG